MRLPTWRSTLVEPGRRNLTIKPSIRRGAVTRTEGSSLSGENLRPPNAPAATLRHQPHSYRWPSSVCPTRYQQQSAELVGADPARHSDLLPGSKTPAPMGTAFAAR